MNDADLACALAREAGELLLRLQRDSGLEGKALGKLGDGIASDFLMAQLARMRPEDGVLCEETLDSAARLAKSRVWIVDPLDGTREYGEGWDDWAVHVALAIDGHPTIGAVALPALGLVHHSDAACCTADDAAPLRLLVSRTRPSPDAVATAERLGATMVPMGSAGAKAPTNFPRNDLVAACVETGTGYVDLCGEPNWMHDIIARHDAAAKASGARIVLSCGFDSIPFDLGVWTVQQAAKAKFGEPAPRVKGRVRKMQGTFSGGTAASLKATMAAAATNPGVLDLMKNPFSLTPGFEGPRQPSGNKPMVDEALGEGMWVAPFVMAAINTRNVHRSNFLLQHAYGTDFVYDEMLITGPGEKGEAIANAVAGDKARGSDQGPKPGEGPSKEERDAGFYDLLFIGEGPKGERIDCVVTGDKDPGYGSTSKMIAETARCLVEDVAGDGGIWTPGALMGQVLADRLQAKAGLTFRCG